MINTNITTTITTITPDMAEELLALNTKNRNVKQNNVKKLAHTLQMGHWELNGEAIKVAADGTILDGQHRLLACVKAGIPFDTLLIEGLPVSAQDTMDKGSRRSMADTFMLHGYAQPAKVATLIRAVIAAEKVGLRDAFAYNNGVAVTEREALERAEREPHLVEIAKITGSRFGSLGLTGKIAGLLFYTFESIDAEDTQFFFNALLDPSELATNHPIYQLRVSLLKIVGNRNRSTANTVLIAALCIKAWNAYRNGETRKLLKFAVGGANPEQFPMPI